MESHRKHMQIKGIIQIDSVIDTITNSSSTVFISRTDDSMDMVKHLVESVGWTFDIKNFKRITLELLKSVGSFDDNTLKERRYTAVQGLRFYLDENKYMNDLRIPCLKSGFGWHSEGSVGSNWWNSPEEMTKGTRSSNLVLFSEVEGSYLFEYSDDSSSGSTVEHTLDNMPHLFRIYSKH